MQKGAEVYTFCRSRQYLSHMYLLVTCKNRRAAEKGLSKLAKNYAKIRRKSQKNIGFRPPSPAYQTVGRWTPGVSPASCHVMSFPNHNLPSPFLLGHGFRRMRLSCFKMEHRLRQNFCCVWLPKHREGNCLKFRTDGSVDAFFMEECIF